MTAHLMSFHLRRFPNVCLSNGWLTYYRRVKGETCPAGFGRGNTPCRIREGEHALGAGWVRLG